MAVVYPSILDFEASGLDAESYPIQVAVLLNGAESYDWFIEPEPSWRYWDPVAESIHGYSRQEIIAKGLPVIEVAVALNHQLKDQTVFCDALEWDGFWLRRLFDAAFIQPCFELHDLSELLSNSQIKEYRHKLEKIAASGNYRQHHAEEDVKLILEAYCQIKDT